MTLQKELSSCSFKDIVSSYDGYIVDLWGVVHNGQAPFPGAVRCLKALKEAGKKVVLLSNAPRRVAPAQARLEEMGIDFSCYDALMTSGEHCHLSLRDRPDPWYQSLGHKFFFLGSPQDQSVFAGLDGYESVRDWDQAQFILATGPRAVDYLEDKELYRIQEVEILQEGLKRQLPLICVNPDLVAAFGDELVVCAGEAARFYSENGGFVRFHGKPHQDIYDWVFEHLLATPKERVLAIGDSLATDVKGAHGNGIDSLWILSGIHGKDLESKGVAVSKPVASGGEEALVAPEILPQLKAFCAPYTVSPSYAMHFWEWI